MGAPCVWGSYVLLLVARVPLGGGLPLIIIQTLVVVNTVVIVHISRNIIDIIAAVVVVVISTALVGVVIRV